MVPKSNLRAALIYMLVYIAMCVNMSLGVQYPITLMHKLGPNIHSMYKCI